MTAARFDFLRIASDPHGYYYDRWDRAVPFSVVAADEPGARAKATELSGGCSDGFCWKFRLERISEISETEATA
jgi:hypothetical protein